jgi:hypothetical protein
MANVFCTAFNSNSNWIGAYWDSGANLPAKRALAMLDHTPAIVIGLTPPLDFVIGRKSDAFQ